MSVTLKVKWGKNSYKCDVNPAEGVEELKMKLFSLTNVPPDRQKIMGFKGGPLKDDAVLSKVGLRNNMRVMLIGTAGELAEIPDAVALQAAEEAKGSGGVVTLPTPIGLNNLGNTCFMNSTLQVMKATGQLQEKLAAAEGSSGDHQLAIAARDLFKQLDNAQGPQPPFRFMSALHKVYPQFAEMSPQGGLMQHDAQECWTSVLESFKRAAPSVGALFQFETEVTLSCVECDAEPAQVKQESNYMLGCPISGSTNYMMQALTENIKGQVEKHSDILGRNAIWQKLTLISDLPANLTVHMMRFFWRQDLNKGAGGKTKITRPVQFSMRLDSYSLCTDKLKKSLDPARAALDARLNAEALGETVEEANQGRPTGYFDLSAVVAHKGRSSDGGHYVSFVKCDAADSEEGLEDPMSKKRKTGKGKRHSEPLWICYDDDKPSYVRGDDILKLSGKGGADHFIGYIMVYSQVTV